MVLSESPEVFAVERIGEGVLSVENSAMLKMNGKNGKWRICHDESVFYAKMASWYDLK